MESHWFDDFSNVLKLARYLCDVGYLCTATEAIYYFEKPWKWSLDWDLLVGGVGEDEAIEDAPVKKTGAN